jgi:carotenoid cleavage dioxygenase
MANKYLEGNFAPVHTEHTAVDLAVTGTVPEHLNGRYVRNGPNPVAEVDPAAYHWFTGDGMVHGVRLQGGRAQWYRNRWVRTPRLAAALGEPPRPQDRHRTGMLGLGANTNVISHAGRTLALVEGGVACWELTDELDTLAPCDFDGTLPGGYTAHPQRDPDTGELHAVSYFFGRGNTVQYSVIGTDGRARRTVDIEVGGSPMMHNFSLTDQHVIFYDLPVTFDPVQGAEITVPRWMRTPAQLVLSALIGRVRVPDPISAAVGRTLRGNANLPYRWDPHYPARVGVMPRAGGTDDVRWFNVEPCYVYHPLNAYDEDDTVVLDVVRHPKMFVRELHGPDEGPATLDRWTIDLADGKLREARLDDHPQEFPRIDERLLGRHYRYGYAVSFEGKAGDAVIKHDLIRNTTTAQSLGARHRADEFVFIPHPGSTAEDDGVLMGFVYNSDTDRSELTLLDAATLDTVATVHLPARVPHGFHGNWLPDAD